MRSLDRRTFCLAALGTGVLGAGLSATGPVRAENINHRLLVAVMALRDGALLADETATYRPFHQYREQHLTLDVPVAGVRRTIMVSLTDLDAGGVKVSACMLRGDGEPMQERGFVMYPFLELGAERIERFTADIIAIANDGEAERHVAPIELSIVMKRVVRG